MPTSFSKFLWGTASVLTGRERGAIGVRLFSLAEKRLRAVKPGLAKGADELPVLDKQPVPVLTPGQWTRIPEDWATNQFRAGLPGTPPLSAPH